MIRWIIVGVKYNFQSDQVGACVAFIALWERLTLWHLTVRVATRWQWLCRCKGRQTWHVAPHDKVSAPLWTALGDCGRALISQCQGLSASVMFTPQVCWLTALPSLLHFSQQTESANRNPPTAATDQTCLLLPLSEYKLVFFHKVYLLHWLLLVTSSFHIFHCVTPLPLSIHLSWSGYGVNHPLTGYQQTWPKKASIFPSTCCLFSSQVAERYHHSVHFL